MVVNNNQVHKTEYPAEYAWHLTNQVNEEKLR